MGHMKIVERRSTIIDTSVRLTHILSVADASCIVAARVLGTDLAADDRILRREALKVLPEAERKYY